MSAIERFEREYITYHRITPERARQQVRELRAFEATLDGRAVTDALQSDLQAYAGSLMGLGLHVNTVRKRLNMVRPFFSWAFASGLISADQYLALKQVKNPRGATANTLPKPYSRKELTAFWQAVDTTLPLLPEKGPGSRAVTRWLQGKGPWRNVARHAMRLQVEAMVRLALDGGLRRAEIFRLSLNDLHYDNDYIVVQGKADPSTGEPKVRKVPFTDEMRRTVYAWLEFRALMRPDHERPWLSCYGPSTFNKPMLWGRFTELLPAVVGPEWRWHRFRHTCATEWLRAGMELETVSRLLGHATLQQTLSYAQIIGSDIARAMTRHQASFAEAVSRAA
jgi:site-specific recombinase XerD